MEKLIEGAMESEDNLKKPYGAFLTDCVLNVPIKTQGVHNCWAACCAAIISFKTTNNVTAEDVCKKIFPDDGDHSGTLYDAIAALGMYGLNAQYYNDVLPFTNNALPTDKNAVLAVKYQLEHSCPMILHCVSQSGGADSNVLHAVVLRGFREDGDNVILYIMDPATASYLDQPFPKDYNASDIYFKLAEGKYIRWDKTLYNIYRK